MLIYYCYYVTLLFQHFLLSPISDQRKAKASLIRIPASLKNTKAYSTADSLISLMLERFYIIKYLVDSQYKREYYFIMN